MSRSMDKRPPRFENDPQGRMPPADERPTTDRVHDILRGPLRSLHRLLHPCSVAVIGATETPGSVGRTLLWNLVSNPFGGTVFPINPKRSNVLGIKAYPVIAAVPE